VVGDPLETGVEEAIDLLWSGNEVSADSSDEHDDWPLHLEVDLVSVLGVELGGELLKDRLDDDAPVGDGGDVEGRADESGVGLGGVADLSEDDPVAEVGIDVHKETGVDLGNLGVLSIGRAGARSGDHGSHALALLSNNDSSGGKDLDESWLLLTLDSERELADGSISVLGLDLWDGINELLGDSTSELLGVVVHP